MPIIKSAIKKLRKDRKREKVNRASRERIKDLIKKAERSSKASDVQAAISAIDKAAKTHLVHKNKAARLTSTLAKLVAKKTAKKIPVKKKRVATPKSLYKPQKKAPTKFDKRLIV